MPIYEITGPDGKKYKVNAPRGANEQDAINHVQETYYSSAPVGKDRSKMSTMDKIMDSPVGGFVRGLQDIPQGAKQFVAGEMANLAPEGSALQDFGQRYLTKYNQAINESERDYQQNTRQGGVDGVDFGRIAGNIVGGLPLAYLLSRAFPAGASVPMLARVLSAAAAGGASSAVMPVMEEDQGDFQKKKLEQVGIGAVSGAVSPFIGDFLGKTFNRFTQKAPTTQQLEANLQGQLSGQGIDYSKLSDQVKASLLKDAQEALKAGGALNPEALARKADFEALGIKPTQGQLTRDPMQFAFEKNTRGIQGAGDSLSQRFNDQNKQLIDAINQLRQGQSTDKYAANVLVQDALRKVDNARGAEVSSLFKQARESAGRDLQLSPFKFTQGLNDALDFEGLGKFLPGDLRADINKIAVGDAPFTMKEAQQLIKVANNHFDKTGQQGSMNKAIGIFKQHMHNAIDDAAANSGDDLGAEAALKFRIANKAARQQFKSLEKVPALKAAIENDIPDQQFIDKYIISKSARPREVLNLRAQLKDHPDVWNEIRGQVVDYIKGNALNGASDEVANFSQSAFNKKGLSQIGDAKLKILFSPDEVAQLKRIGKVSEAIQLQPSGSAVNNSGTSQAVANLMTRLSGVPYLKELAINPVMNFKLQGKVNSALNPSVGSMTTPIPVNPQIPESLYLPLAISGYPLLNESMK